MTDFLMIAALLLIIVWVNICEVSKQLSTFEFNNSLLASTRFSVNTM